MGRSLSGYTMYLDPDRCLSCGTYARPHRLDVPANCYGLEPGGTLEGLSGFYWFCGPDHYKKEVRKFLDDEYDFDVYKKFLDDENFDDYIDRLIPAQRVAIINAVDKLIRHIQAQDKHEFEEELRKEEEMEAR